MGELLRKAASALVGERHSKPVTILRTMLPAKGLAILLVVLAHSVIYMLAIEVNAAPGVHLGPVVLGAWQISSMPKSIVLELCRCAVPLFLFLSGYYTLMTPRTWSATWSNCRKLVIPMVTWSIVGWASSWRKGSGGWSVLEFLELFFSGRTQTGYFFIVLITQYYVLSRWLVPAMAKRPGLLLGLSFLLQLSVHAYDYVYLLSRIGAIAPVGWILAAGPFPEYLFPRFMASFALGIWASQSGDRFRGIIGARFPAVAAAAALAAALVVVERGLLFYRAYAGLGMSEFEATATSWVEWKFSITVWTIAAVFLVFGIFQRRIPLKAPLEALGRYSFQIFILHGFILDIVNAALYRVPDLTTIHGLAGSVVLFVFGIAGPVLMTMAIKKFLPAPLRILLIGA
jgi:fucose 4-O-acetylase-like acetyltransferase